MDLSNIILKDLLSESFELDKSIGRNARTGAVRGAIQGGVVGGISHLMVKRLQKQVHALELAVKSAKDPEKRSLEIELAKKRGDLTRFKVMRIAGIPAGSIAGATVGVISGVPGEFFNSKVKKN